MYVLGESYFHTDIIPLPTLFYLAKRFCPESPTILVGTKIEKRNDPGNIATLDAYGKAPMTTEEV